MRRVIVGMIVVAVGGAAAGCRCARPPVGIRPDAGQHGEAAAGAAITGPAPARLRLPVADLQARADEPAQGDDGAPPPATADGVQRALSGHYPALRACVALDRASGRVARGTLVVAFTIAPSGEVADVAVAGDGGASVRSCALGIARALAFAPGTTWLAVEAPLGL